MGGYRRLPRSQHESTKTGQLRRYPTEETQLAHERMAQTILYSSRRYTYIRQVES